jgi:hypothetical protein
MVVSQATVSICMGISSRLCASFLVCLKSYFSLHSKGQGMREELGLEDT